MSNPRSLNREEIASLNNAKKKSLERLKKIIGILEKAQNAIRYKRVESLSAVLGIVWDNGDECERFAERIEKELRKLQD